MKMLGKPTTFVPAARDFFGLAPGQQLRGFMDECKSLPDKDKAELSAMLKSEGYNIPVHGALESLGSPSGA